MAWINSSRQLVDVIFHALFLQPTNEQQKQLRASADQQLCQWKKDAMNFGDCASQLVAAAFNFQGRNPFENSFYGCSAPKNNNNNHSSPADDVALALSAALMIDDVASPQKWIEAQVFSDKSQVVSLIHRVAFYARPYSEETNNNNNNSENSSSVFEISNVLKVALNRTSLPLEHKVAKICLNALAGMIVAEFPNSNWINFIYAVSKTSKCSGSSSSSNTPATSTANGSKSGSPHQQLSRSQPMTPTTNNQGIFPSSNKNNNNTVPSSSVHDVPLSRRYLWMYFVAQRLAALPVADAFTEDKIGLRLALLDFLENAMKNSSSNNTQTAEEVEELILQWKIARVLLLQLPASKRGDYPVVRSLVSEAGRRIFSCLEDDENNDQRQSQNEGNSNNDDNLCFVNLSWFNINAMTVVRDQLLMLKAAPPNMVVGPLVRLLMKSILPSITNDEEGHNDVYSQILNTRNQIPGPLWKTAFEVLLSLLEKHANSDEKLQEFCANMVPLQILIRLVAHTLTIAPGSDEVFAVPRHKALLSSEEVNDDDMEEICFPEDFLSSNNDNNSRSTMKWRPITNASIIGNDDNKETEISRKLEDFYGDDGQDYFAAREQSLVNDVKEIDSAVTGSTCGSLSACCIAIIELLVENAPDESSNFIGQVVATELLPFDLSPSQKNASSDDFINEKRNEKLVGNIHGVCTLFLAAFRVFNINGTTSFSKAVRNQRDAALLFERLMNLCLGLMEIVQNDNTSRHWDTTHSVARLLVVGCLLCEGGSSNLNGNNNNNVDERNMDKFVDDVCLSLLLSSSNNNNSKNNNNNILLLHSASIYCLFRLCIKSPSIRSRVTLALFQQPEKIRIFVDILSNSDNNNIEEQIPFSCFAITELTSTVLALGSPDHVNQMWQSESFFRGFLFSLVRTLLNGSLQVNGAIVSQSLKKILDLLISDHGDTKRNCCMQIQCILDPALQLLFGGSDNNNNDNSNLLTSSPAARILCGVLKDLLLHNMKVMSQEEEEMNNNNTQVCSPGCSCTSRYFSRFLSLTQSVTLAESEAHPADSNVRFTANCAAVVCAFVAASSPAEGNSHNLVAAADLMLRQISLYQKVLPSMNSAGGGGNNSKLSSRTISVWGFAAGFCISTLAELNHPQATNAEALTSLAQGIISQTCSYLRLSTKDCDLVGVCFLFAKIGRVCPQAATDAMKNISARDASLFWSLWCTIACETTNQRDYKPTLELWNYWASSNSSNNNNNNSENDFATVNLSAQLTCYVLPPSGSRKTSKNSIVADDFARNGKLLSCPAEAIAFVEDFRNNSPQFNALPKNRGMMFEEGCFSRLF